MWIQLIKRFVRFLRGNRKGDYIVGNVGEDAHGVAVGKNIIQIGRLVIPTIPVLALMLMVAALLAFLVLRPRGPTKMTGEFNIAVAEFGQVGQDGQVRPSKDGQQLSQWLFERLVDEYEDPSLGLAVRVWHDSLELGVKIGVVSGPTPEARAEAAAALAEKINAQVVIYGSLALDQNPATFTPEFYVSELPDAEEIVGRHELGAPIQVQIPIERLGTRLQLNQKLASRTRALTLFTVGLAWEFARDPGKALEFFRRAERVEGWANEEGKELLYLFIGRAAQSLENDAEALSAFQQALTLNPNYARAYIGLGNNYFGKAQRLHPADRFETIELDQAILQYLRALETASLSPGTRVELKAHMALAGAYRLKGEAFLHVEEHSTANAFFNAAIEGFETALSLVDGEQHRYLGQTYFGLGAALHEKAYTRRVQGAEAESRDLYEQALDAYAKCIKLADDEPSDWSLKELKTDYCVPNQEAAQTAFLDFDSTGQ